MKTEEAIEILQNGMWWDLLVPITTVEGRYAENKLHEAIDLAVTALRASSDIGESSAHIDRSKWTAKNVTDQNPVDQFICSECGVILEDFSLCKIDEDSGDKTYYEYELKFCPSCGRPLTEEAWAELERRLRGNE